MRNLSWAMLLGALVLATGCADRSAVSSVQQGLDGATPVPDADAMSSSTCTGGAPNGVCDMTEDCASCVEDCPCDGSIMDASTCGDGICDPSEDCSLCPADCTTCDGGMDAAPDASPDATADATPDASTCGDMICQSYETCDSCPSDCACAGSTEVFGSPGCGTFRCGDACADFATLEACLEAECNAGCALPCIAEYQDGSGGVTSDRSMARHVPCDGCSGTYPNGRYICPSCTTATAAMDCDDMQPCTVDSCDSLGNCVNDAMAAAGMECRAADPALECDAAEVCDGVAGACPDDDPMNAMGIECRASTGMCDAAEVCDGMSTSCPPEDNTSTAGMVCRPSVDDCDVEETCDGMGTDCPMDAVEPMGTECRADAGDCDVAEVCDGMGTACPVDAFEPMGTMCSDGITCTDPDECDGMGVCVPGPSNCDDMCAGTTDGCDETTGVCDYEVTDPSMCDCPLTGVPGDVSIMVTSPELPRLNFNCPGLGGEFGVSGLSFGGGVTYSPASCLSSPSPCTENLTIGMSGSGEIKFCSGSAIGVSLSAMITRREKHCLDCDGADCEQFCGDAYCRDYDSTGMGSVSVRRFWGVAPSASLNLPGGFRIGVAGGCGASLTASLGATLGYRDRETVGADGASEIACPGGDIPCASCGTLSGTINAGVGGSLNCAFAATLNYPGFFGFPAGQQSINVAPCSNCMSFSVDGYGGRESRFAGEPGADCGDDECGYIGVTAGASATTPGLNFGLAFFSVNASCNIGVQFCGESNNCDGGGCSMEYCSAFDPAGSEDGTCNRVRYPMGCSVSTCLGFSC